ncbi:MAG: D-glycero-beta-D-manno-heptose-7-phosphate kinase [Acidobacteriota bacterium]|jgi:rfaE bifunctional protein, domain I|nr:D-glycero-beta-D-manno-heptose-7-phosphate kinase [Acidobacteriota bacterium]OQB57993.1 MAG: Bifunctional protein HldE [Candidatus Aminicenantes bacterium ADurb.Bin147]HNQ81421.1 D-glycero-beta-D-manno-heptose-7-phosphate kinase [Candidatus Aminicenantes bacterium]MDD8038236.1 D-glycero-beta-D-manno-heptose-7-phosphate kinase [Acidobacteriota bacterium]MDW3226335.1 D-glycero-beta-D-manno-heptose-7-phosphate kinase [Acidobacteriota bacterium]
MTTISLSLPKARRAVLGFRNRRVLVLGDLMLDKYIWGSVSRISPEAPVPVVEVQRSTTALGGAGNVAHNLEALKAAPLLVGVVGDDEEGQWIKKHVPDGRGIFLDPERPTTVKTRIIAQHQQVVRVDQEKKQAIPVGMEDRIVRLIKKEKYAGIIISDYCKGIVTRQMMTRVLAHATEARIPVFVDPKVENFSLFSPVTLITPNHHEAERVVRHSCRTDEEVEQAGREIMEMISCLYLILKRSEQGMSIFERGKKPVHIPTIAREVFDVTGAGDTVIATAALAMLGGLSIREAAVMANAAAGVVVGKIGTATCAPEELLAAVEDH